MKRLMLGALIAGAFVYYTQSSVRRALPNIIPSSDAPKTAYAESPTPLQKQSEAGLGSDERNNIDIYREASPAVVNITTKMQSYDFFMNVIPSEGAGSGFLIDDEGRIVTNNHVVAGAGDISVVIGRDSTRYPAKLIGSDERS